MGLRWGTKTFLVFMYIDLQLLFSKFCFILILSCSLSLCWDWVVVEVGLGCSDNISSISRDGV